MPANSTPLLELRQIVKEYPGCLANDRVDLTLMPGEIHALLGENGAGKSTLVKILYGVLQADAGQLRWQGNRVDIASPAYARSLGIAMVFQHFSLFDSLSVKENIALGLDSVEPADLGARIEKVSRHYGLPLDPDRFVYTLSVGERQRIEIVRCLLQEPRLLIMDEPTSVLTPQEVEQLFKTLRRLSEEGVAILYISHKLDEIKALCHQATILRGGKRVASADPAVESATSLAAMMIGNEVDLPVKPASSASGRVRLSLNNLSLPAPDTFSVPLKSINLEVHAGEILGLAGVAGNGQDELLNALSGEVTCADTGMLTLHDHDEPSSERQIGRLGPGLRRQLGLCCVPEERLGHAAVPEMSLTENAFLTARHRLPVRRAGFVRPLAIRRFAQQVVDQFQVQCRSTESAANSLSGGNLQKFVVGREILQQPDVLIVAQPTWGVDAGAAAAIHSALLQLAANGSAVLVISQDLDELMTISDRITAICAGEVAQVYPVAEMSVQQMGLLMGGQSAVDDAPAGGSAHA